MNITFRTILFYTTVLVLPKQVYPLEVSTVGSCWVGEGVEGDGTFRIASFGNEEAFELTHFAKGKLEEKLEHLFQSPLGGSSAYLHCGPYGHFLMLSLKNEVHAYCAWAYKEGDDFKVDKWGVDFGYKNGPCLPATPLTLIGWSSFFSEEIRTELAAKMQLAPYRKVVKDWQFFGPGAVKFFLEEDFRYKENEALELLRPLVKERLIEGLEFEYPFNPIGDFFHLW